ncbi:hypothetical protein B0H16DRAFT_1729110 [Mycena metata]|uniref:Secreted protein n=1 Tax=Mycena metata TaxID=1033252 RepID=A0AAD7ICK7_9AGAR|nr:hypothetical protein B0H16DRAFT_1729110 [Mycena metata]
MPMWMWMRTPRPSLSLCVAVVHLNLDLGLAAAGPNWEKSEERAWSSTSSHAAARAFLRTTSACMATVFVYHIRGRSPSERLDPPLKEPLKGVGGPAANPASNRSNIGCRRPGLEYRPARDSRDAQIIQRPPPRELGRERLLLLLRVHLRMGFMVALLLTLPRLGFDPPLPPAWFFALPPPPLASGKTSFPKLPPIWENLVPPKEFARIGGKWGNGW